MQTDEAVSGGSCWKRPREQLTHSVLVAKGGQKLRAMEQPGDKAACLLPEAGQFQHGQPQMAGCCLGGRGFAAAHTTREQPEGGSALQVCRPAAQEAEAAGRSSRRGSALGIRAAADVPLPPRAFQKYQALPEATDDLRRAQLSCVTQGT